MQSDRRATPKYVQKEKERAEAFIDQLKQAYLDAEKGETSHEDLTEKSD